MMQRILACIAVALFTPQVCPSAEPQFVEILISSEVKDGQTEEVMAYVKTTDLSETAVSKEELRHGLKAFKDTVTRAIVNAIVEAIMPDPSKNARQESKAAASGTEAKKIPPEVAKIQPLLIRGVFMEIRTTRRDGSKEITRSVLQVPRKKEGKERTKSSSIHDRG